MSLLLSRLSKLRGRRSCLLLLSNDFSSSLMQMQTPPCLICGLDVSGITIKEPICSSLGRLLILNANKRDGKFIVVEKKVPLEVLYNDCFDAKMVTIGASHGWVATLKDDEPGILRLQDDLIPIASKSDPKRIPLPPLVTLRHCQTQIVTNVSMSSSSPEEDEDCVVAVKFLGPQLSFCRPAQRDKAEWTNIKIENPYFYSSRVMFSKKDNTFRIPGSGGHLIGSWDLRSQKPIKIQKLRFGNLPEWTKTKTTQELMGSCFTSQHLVESLSTGETFMVKQYKKTTDGFTKHGDAKLKTEFVMVFKIDDEGIAVYTPDIGDLAIFISNSEPFCAPASFFPGLHANVVNIADNGENVAAVLDGYNQPIIVGRNMEDLIPYYIPPQNIV